ncbi:MAG: hypothetical protein M3N56_08535, partial [Actinomycetota bacterium]|nr:hypothetical protein [Actinomycetota bacterium]
PHERYPVGVGSLDRLEGVVHLRDLLAGARREAAGTVGELGRRPDPGDTVAVDSVQIRVEAVDGLRITGLQVTLPR